MLHMHAFAGVLTPGDGASVVAFPEGFPRYTYAYRVASHHLYTFLPLEETSGSAYTPIWWRAIQTQRAAALKEINNRNRRKASK